MATLSFLRAETRNVFVKRSAEQMLASPFGWPADPELEAKAIGLGLVRPAPATGEALLLAPEDSKSRALWVLGREHGLAHSTELAFDALEALQRAGRLCTCKGLPFAIGVPQGAAGWRVRSFNNLDTTQLRGPSFGAAMLLAYASFVMDVPVPGDLAASAALGPQGELHPVGLLEAKLRAVSEDALGVRRVAVAQCQAAEAESLASGLPRPLTIVPVEDVEGLLALAFPHARAVLESRLADPQWTAAAAERVFATALDNEPWMLDWRPVVAAAEAVAAAAPDEASRERARIAAAIALRHATNGGEIAIPSASFLAQLQRDRRNKLVAQVLQAHTNSGSPQLAEAIDWAGTFAAESPHESSESQLWIWGARGRALAALRRYDEAAAHLERTVQAWIDMGKAAEGSRPACELARACGLAGRTLPAVLGTLRPALGPRSRVFLDFAVRRALVLRGEFEGALAVPDHADEEVESYLRRGLLRWRIAALEGLGRDASVEWRRLESRADEVEVLLARLDAELAKGAADERLAELLSAIEAKEPGTVGLVLRNHDGEPVRERARALAREYPD